MIKLWTYNELAAALDPKDSSVELFLPRPGTATSKHNIRIDQEVMEGSAWSAWSLANIIAGTNVEAGASVDATKPLRRALNNTKATTHKKGAPAWVEWTPEILDADTVEDLPFLASGAQPNTGLTAIEPDGSGGWYIGGSFATVDGVSKAGSARIRASGILDTGFTADCNANVNAFALNEDRTLLAIGGAFTTCNSVTCAGLVIVDALTGSLIQTFVLGGTGACFAIEWNGTDLYVGGDFTSIDAVSVNYAARLTLTGSSTWSVDTWTPNPNSVVRHIELGSTQIYIGGDFTTISGTTRNAAAAVDDDGELTDWNPNVVGTIYRIREFDDAVYICGGFTSVNGTSKDNLAKVDIPYGSLDTTFVADTNASVYDLLQTGDVLLVAGLFTTINATTAEYLATVEPTTGALRVNFGLDALVRSASISDSRIGLAGSFTTHRNYALFVDGSYAFSPIGQYDCELEYNGQTGAELETVTWRMYRDGALVYEGDEVTEFEPRSGGLRVPGPELSMPNPVSTYTIEAVVVTSLGSYTERVSFGARSIDAIYLIPIGMESGDQFDESDGLTMPSPSNPSKAGNTYTLSLPDQTDSPTVTVDHYFYRIYAILAGDGPAYQGGNRFTIDRSIGSVSEVENVPYQSLYSAELDWNDQNASFTLDLTFDDSLGSSVVTTSETHPGASSDLLNPDQVQIEREIDTGALTGPQFGRFISDWQDVPNSFQFQYVNQGPGAHTYRYRCRYRDFRRDGVEDERGPVEVTSDWSDWTPFV